MKKILFFIFTCCCLSIYGQKARYYIHIPDKQDVPFATASLGKSGGKVVLQAGNETLSKTINKYNVTVFKQAFPNAVTDWLREVYYVECDSINTNAQLSLYKTVQSQFRETIPLIEELGEPMSTGGEVYTPSDPLFSSHAAHQANLELIRAPETWEITRRYPKIDVVVHDLTFANHEDLNYKSVLYNVQPPLQTNFVHGAFVAGCLGATTDNNKGIASLGGLNTNLVVTTKNWCDDNGVLELARAGYKVINCSWVNGYYFSSIIDALYKEIRDIHNTVVVFGAGNGKIHGGATTKRYPSSYESVLSVTSVGHKNNVGHAGNQNWKDVHELIIGDELSTHHHNDAIDLCAPGYDVLSVMNGSYSESDGTSFAAPQVAAAAALVRVVNPLLTAKQVIDILKSTADASIYNIPQNRKYIGQLGTGRLDAYEAVKKACSVTLANNTFANETYDGCIIDIKNAVIPSGRTLTLNVTKEVNVEGTLTIDTGGRLDVIYSGIEL